MPDQYKEDKTEKATPKRRSEARKKGNVAYSQEIDFVIMILGSAIGLYWFAPFMREKLMILFRDVISRMNYPFTPDNLVSFIYSIAVDTLKILAPMLVLIMFLSFLSHWVQVGNLLTMDPLRPKLNKLMPKFSELKLFKKDKMVKLGVSLGKLAVIAPVAYFSVTKDMENQIKLMDENIVQIFDFICLTIYKVVFRIGEVMIVLAIIDYVYQKWKHEEELKMTKQEVKDERKNADQDPHIKSRIRSMGREIMRKLMFNEVPKADVVITNPTHIAVAIKYDHESMAAPRVVAKGVRLIAEKIKEIARENNVPIIENKPLARILYKTVEVGSEVPPDLYKAVAEILAYVYKLNKKKIPRYAA